MTRLVCAGLILALACAGPKSPARGKARVVSLVPSVTEIVYALGAEQSLVGNTNQCDYPEAARSVYKVGDFMGPDMERIVALEPTLVFAALPMHQQLITKLEEMKVPIYRSQPADIEAVFREIDSVGVLVGKRAQARRLVVTMKATLDSLPRSADTPSVYVEISSTPLMTAGGRTFINGLIQRAGGRNAFADAAMEYPVIDPEMVVQRDPTTILVLHPDVTAADVAARVGWSRIDAVRNGRVYDNLDYDLFFRPGPRIVQGIVQLARLLHPPQ